MTVAGQCLNLDLVLLPPRTAAQQHRRHQIKDGNSRGIPLHLAAVLVKSQPVAGRNDSVGFSAGLTVFLSDGVTVAQRSLEPLVVVRIHVGQPIEDQRQTAGCIFVMLSFDSPRPLT